MLYHPQPRSSSTSQTSNVYYIYREREKRWEYVHAAPHWWMQLRVLARFSPSNFVSQLLIYILLANEEESRKLVNGNRIPNVRTAFLFFIPPSLSLSLSPFRSDSSAADGRHFEPSLWFAKLAQYTLRSDNFPSLESIDCWWSMHSHCWDYYIGNKQRSVVCFLYRRHFLLFLSSNLAVICDSRSLGARDWLPET